MCLWPYRHKSLARSGAKPESSHSWESLLGRSLECKGIPSEPHDSRGGLLTVLLGTVPYAVAFLSHCHIYHWTVVTHCHTNKMLLPCEWSTKLHLRQGETQIMRGSPILQLVSLYAKASFLGYVSTCAALSMSVAHCLNRITHTMKYLPELELQYGVE